MVEGTKGGGVAERQALATARLQCRAGVYRLGEGQQRLRRLATGSADASAQHNDDDTQAVLPQWQSHLGCHWHTHRSMVQVTPPYS